MRNVFIGVGFGLLMAHLPLWSQPDSVKDEKKSVPPPQTVTTGIAPKATVKAPEAPGVVTVFNRDDLTRLGGATLAELLCRIPGIAYNADNPTDVSKVAFSKDGNPKTADATKISTNTLVLIDGRPLKELQTAEMKSRYYENLPVTSIDHIELIKGPGSVVHGSETYSSVVNVVTEKTKKP